MPDFVKRLKLTLVLVAVFLASSANWIAGANSSDWRFWKMTDGLSESYTSFLSIDHDLRLTLTHGDVDAYTILDGYRTIRFPSPKERLSVYSGADGQLWTKSKTEWDYSRMANGWTTPFPRL